MAIDADHAARLADANPQVVGQALQAMQGWSRVPEEYCGILTELLYDARVYCEASQDGPYHSALSDLALWLLVRAGPIAREALCRACDSTHSVTVPASGDGYGYSWDNFVVAEVAPTALARLRERYPEHAPKASIGAQLQEALSMSEPWTLGVRLFLEECCRQHPRAGLCEPLLSQILGHASTINGYPRDDEPRYRAEGWTALRAQLTAVIERSREQSPEVAPLWQAVLGLLSLDLNLTSAVSVLSLLDAELSTEPMLSMPWSRAPLPRAQVLEGLLHRYSRPGTRFGSAPPPPAGERLTAPQRFEWCDLLDAVYRDLDADEPRLAYAQWLTERGSPRGAFIAAQYDADGGLNHRQGSAAVEQARALLARYGKHWSLHPDVVQYERGFPLRALHSKDTQWSGLQAVLDEPTVTELNAIGGLSARGLKLLDSRRLRGLGVRAVKYDEQALRDLLASTCLAELDRLSLIECDLNEALLGVVLSAPFARRLTQLDLSGNGLGGQVALELRHALPGLRRLEC